MDANKLLKDILQYVSDSGGLFSGWYIGITNDPRRRLFTEHGVAELTGHWIHGQCESAELARAIEANLLQQGFDGGGGGGDHTAVHVYVYKKTSLTRGA